MSDRTYWRVSGAWHADSGDPDISALCGRVFRVVVERVQFADRIPPNGHLCGNCARIIAARTDIEPTPEQRAEFKRAEYARTVDLRDRALRRVEDVPEPVATEHDDFEGAPV